MVLIETGEKFCGKIRDIYTCLTDCVYAYVSVYLLINVINEIVINESIIGI